MALSRAPSRKRLWAPGSMQGSKDLPFETLNGDGLI